MENFNFNDISPENLAFLEQSELSHHLVLHEKKAERIAFPTLPFEVEYDPQITPEAEKIIGSFVSKEFPQTEKTPLAEALGRVELFETFLGKKFIGQKRFSLEGAESMIPMLGAIIASARSSGAERCVLGMSHRGRLSVLAHILEQPLEEIFAEFRELESTDQNHAQDVKYHKGYSTKKSESFSLELLSNPSHLESIDPVLEGYVRALQEKSSRKKVIPLLIHGDAAFAGQGTVYETAQFSHLEGWTTGGTIHIIINNHIGFTANPREYSTAGRITDIAKAFGFPTIHVDAANPEASILAAHLAFELRDALATDVLIDLSCVRLHGHNESDEPAFTQPLLYEKIHGEKTAPRAYAEQVGFDITAFAIQYGHTLESALERAALTKNGKTISRKSIQASGLEQLLAYAERITTYPEGFSIHKKLAKNLLERRTKIGEEKALYLVDWTFAEALAFASALSGGVPCRLTGQDTKRGTFSQRHAVYIDQKTEAQYIPLEHIREGQARFSVYNSLLSEYAALGFEYGYSTGCPEGLTLWEAQYGDFANAAQVIIDQYIASGAAKWDTHSNLVLLLPHGYEGQGPEHSSARIERFLELAAQGNMTIANPTTPSQYFHLLVEQAQKNVPLVIFTPKGLLRLPQCRSSLQNLADGHFEDVMIDEIPGAKKVVLCQGRIYYDLLGIPGRDFSIVRIEQLYPLNLGKISSFLKTAEKHLWVQEEPQNGGSWHYMKDKIESLSYIGRGEAASPAVGFIAQHRAELAEILNRVRCA